VVVEVVLTVRADDPEPVTDEGLKTAVEPVGRLLAENVTVPVNPTPGLTVTV
jgi:hypothetical protein